MKKVARCGLKAVQLHGQEPAELAENLQNEGLLVIKALFMNRAPSLDCAGSFRTSAYLIECAGGPLPGGNALAWDYRAAAGLSVKDPVILAGGINPDNVSRAIREASPDAVDVSSGVESAPGTKDMDKVKRLLEAVATTDCLEEAKEDLSMMQSQPAAPISQQTTLLSYPDPQGTFRSLRRALCSGDTDAGNP